jgi:hypothetical protein
MPRAKLLLLRALHVLAFPDNLIVQKAWKNNKELSNNHHHANDRDYDHENCSTNNFLVTFGDEVQQTDLEQILNPKVHPFAVQSLWSREGFYCPVDGVDADLQSALLSFASENGLLFVAWRSIGGSSLSGKHIYIRKDTVFGNLLLRGGFSDEYPYPEERTLTLTKSNKVSKGDNRASRNCGLWSISSSGRAKKSRSKTSHNNTQASASDVAVAVWVRLDYGAASDWKNAYEQIQQQALANSSSNSTSGGEGEGDTTQPSFLSFKTNEGSGSKNARSKSRKKTKATANNANAKIRFELDGSGRKMSRQDLTDLFSTPSVTETDAKKKQGGGSTDVSFPFTNSSNSNSSTPNSLFFKDLPEAVQIIAAVLSGRFKGSVINFVKTKKNAEDNTNESSQAATAAQGQSHDGEDFREVKVSAGDGRTLKVQYRWSQLEEKGSSSSGGSGKGKQQQQQKGGNGSGATYISDVFSVPALASSVDSCEPLFACASTRMEMQGGAARFGGLTIVSNGTTFVELVFLCFGLSFPSTKKWSTNNKHNRHTLDGGQTYLHSMEWLDKKDEAELFYEECLELDAEIKCCPMTVTQLLSVFEEPLWPEFHKDINLWGRYTPPSDDSDSESDYDYDYYESSSESS